MSSQIIHTPCHHFLPSRVQSEVNVASAHRQVTLTILMVHQPARSHATSHFKLEKVAPFALPQGIEMLIAYEIKVSNLSLNSLLYHIRAGPLMMNRRLHLICETGTWRTDCCSGIFASCTHLSATPVNKLLLLFVSPANAFSSPLARSASTLSVEGTDAGEFGGEVGLKKLSSVLNGCEGLLITFFIT